MKVLIFCLQTKSLRTYVIISVSYNMWALFTGIDIIVQTLKNAARYTFLLNAFQQHNFSYTLYKEDTYLEAVNS